MLTRLRPLWMSMLYIAMLKSEGPQRWLWEEDKELCALDLQFRDEKNPSDLVQNYVHSLQEYPIEDILSTDQVSEFRLDLITELLSLLNPQNVQIEVAAKIFEDKCTLTEPWYGTKYFIEDIPENLLQEWSTVIPSEELKLPPPNEFIPTDLSLVKCDDEQHNVLYPTMIKDTPRIRLWHKNDTEFFMPKGYITLELNSPIIYADPLSYNLSKLWIDLLHDSLQESTYAAACAGMSWNIWNSDEGITANIQGYDDKQRLLLDIMMEQIVNYKTDCKRFYIIKESFIRAHKNFDSEPPWEHANVQQDVCLTHNYWTRKQLLDAAEDITPEQVDEFSSRMIRNIHIEILVYGNFTKQRAIEIGDCVENKLPKDGRPLLANQMMKSRDIELDESSWYLMEVQNNINVSSCALVYYACGLHTSRQGVLLEILGQILAEPCFDTLRTKEQLGYIVL